MATASIEEEKKATLESHNASLFRQIDDYDWASDREFQAGLHSILGSDAPPEQAAHLILRARCFYFARKNNIPVDFDAYKTWRRQHTAASTGAPLGTPLPPPETTEKPLEPPAPYPTSFSQIVELISSGQSIPGIKHVPDIVLEGQSSLPAVSKRKKPWETPASG